MSAVNCRLSTSVLIAALFPMSQVNAQSSSPGQRARDALLLKDVTVVLQGNDTAKTSVVFYQQGTLYRVRSIGRVMIRTDAPDTVDGAGLYLHSANAFGRPSFEAGGEPMLVVRRGLSPGSQAVMVINTRDDVGRRDIKPAENYPTGPMSPWVGCYDVSLGDWDDPRAAAGMSVAPVPTTLRLHWQFKWHLGRENVLVATDAHGSVPGLTTYNYWWSSKGDSVSVGFGNGFTQATFKLSADGDDLVGAVIRSGDTVPGPRARATARLVKRNCPPLR